MGAQQERPSDLQARFLQYLHEEKQNIKESIKQGDRRAVEDRKRLRQIEREIETLKGGAL